MVVCNKFLLQYTQSTFGKIAGTKSDYRAHRFQVKKRLKMNFTLPCPRRDIQRLKDRGSKQESDSLLD